MSKDSFFLRKHYGLSGPSPWVSNDGWTVSEQWVEICVTRTKENSFHDREWIILRFQRITQSDYILKISG